MLLIGPLRYVRNYVQCCKPSDISKNLNNSPARLVYY